MSITAPAVSDAPLSPFASAAGAWWMIAVFLFTALISYSDRLILSVLVDPIRAELGLSDSAVGFLQGPAFTVVYVLAALVFGWLADRGKRKALLITGVLVWCTATVLCGLAPNGSVLLAGRLLLGAGEAVLLPTVFSMIADAFASERLGIANGTMIVGTVVGGPLGITVGGLLLAAAKGGAFASWPLIGGLAPWRFVLVSVGLTGLLSPILLLTVREPSRRQQSQGRAQGSLEYFRSDSRRLLPLYGAMALLSIGDYGLVSWVPTTLSRRFGWTSDQVGPTFGVVTAAAGVTGSLLGGWISDLAERRSAIPGRLAISVGAGVFAMFAATIISLGRAELTVVGLGLWVLASTVGAVGAFCVVQELVPSQFRGSSIALLTFSNTLIGLGCGPTLVAFVTDHVYRVSTAVDRSITTVTLPAAILACALLLLARYRLRERAAQPIQDHWSAPWDA
jgi:MFS family permease